MTKESKNAQTAFDHLVKNAVFPILKPIGFRKSGMNFYRRKGSVVQVINFQSSQGSSPTQKTFYVNVGLAFDAVCELMNVDVLEKPKEYDCDLRGKRDRLNFFVDSMPARWELSAEKDIEAESREIKNAMEHLSHELDQIDSTTSYYNHFWFNCDRPGLVNAQILYIEGEFVEARNEVQAICSSFKDRKKLNDPEYWIDELGLEGLR